MSKVMWNRELYSVPWHDIRSGYRNQNCKPYCVHTRRTSDPKLCIKGRSTTSSYSVMLPPLLHLKSQFYISNLIVNWGQTWTHFGSVSLAKTDAWEMICGEATEPMHADSGPLKTWQQTSTFMLPKTCQIHRWWTSDLSQEFDSGHFRAPAFWRR